VVRDCEALAKRDAATMPKTMKAVQVPKAGSNFELLESPVPEPQPGEVRIKAYDQMISGRARCSF
jgi:hypothetical protein